MTWTVLMWELIGAFFYFSPMFPQAMRLVGVTGFLMMHLGFGLSAPQMIPHSIVVHLFVELPIAMIANGSGQISRFV